MPFGLGSRKRQTRLTGGKMKPRNKSKSLSEKRRLSKFGRWKTAPYGWPITESSGGQGKSVNYKWPKKK